MTSHWSYRGKTLTEIPEGAFGFIYRITEKKTGRKYIGRKYFFSTRRTKVAGKVRRKVVVKESDWRTYMGSSKPLLEDIDSKGVSKFLFEIVAIAYTKGQLNYAEEAYHFKYDVLLDPSYYNDSIGSKRFIGVKVDENFVQMIKTL